MSEQFLFPHLNEIQQNFDFETPLRSPESPLNVIINKGKVAYKEIDLCSENSANFSFQGLKLSELNRDQISSLKNDLQFMKFFKKQTSERILKNNLKSIDNSKRNICSKEFTFKKR